MVKLFVSFILMMWLSSQPAQVQKPLIFPVAAPPGPSTWLFGQPYGNTVGAYNFGTAWYSSGQGLHFGIDVGMPCGTELVAAADGQVAAVDNLNFGSGPHNLIIRHDALGIASLYGHLQYRPALVEGQTVTQGQVIAVSGDPDVTCDSRPHLHYEVRSLDFWTTYNPVDYININWHNLANIGSYSYPLFQGDMDNARRWMTLEDQPPVRFGGARLNAYQAVYPPPQTERPTPAAALARDLPEVADSWTARRIADYQWVKWWHPTDPNRFYTIDGADGQRAAVFEWSAESGEMQAVVRSAPPNFQSPDGTVDIVRENGQVFVSTSGQQIPLQTNGATPSISADNSRLMWVYTGSIAVPGSPRPNSTIYISNLDGTNVRELRSEPGVSAQWLDESRLLITKQGDHRLTTLSVYDTADDTQFELGAWTWIRHISAAPGGGRLLFYLTNQTDTAANGLYTLEVKAETSAQKIDWFGGWRWRDGDSLYYIPLDVQAEAQTLHYYDISSGEDRVLDTPPFTVMNGDWAVSPDGQRILFHNAADGALWMLEGE